MKKHGLKIFASYTPFCAFSVSVVKSDFAQHRKHQTKISLNRTFIHNQHLLITQIAFYVL